MATPVWTYEIRDLRTNTLMETVPLEGVDFGKSLNDTDTFQATLQLPLYNSLGQLREAYELTMPAHTSVYAYRDSRPVWGGIIWTSNYDSATGKLSIGAADWWSYFDHRKILPVLAAQAYTDTAHIGLLATTYTGIDQNQIARNLLSLAQSHTGGDVGIVADTHDSFFNRTRTYAGFQMTSMGDVWRNLTRVIDGPDIRFDVAFPGADGKPGRRMLLGTPQLGQTGSPWVWELGGNVQAYKWSRDGTRMRSRSFAVGEGSDKYTPIGAYQNTALYDLGWPVLEGDTTYDRTSGDTSTLPNHARADQELTELPVILPALEVQGDKPPTVSEVSPGDDGRLIIEDAFHGYLPPRGTRGLDTRARIIKLRVKPDDSGEKVTYTLAPLLDVVS